MICCKTCAQAGDACLCFARFDGFGGGKIIKPPPRMGFKITQRFVFARQVIQYPCEGRVLMHIGQIARMIDMLIRQHRGPVRQA